MSIHDLLDKIEFTEEEQDIIANKLSNPLLRKYLKSLAQADIKSLASIRCLEMSAVEVEKAHVHIEGCLTVYNTLLGIKSKEIDKSKDNLKTVEQPPAV